MTDTNVIISALLFPDSTPAVAFRHILAEERLVLSQWILDELHEVIGRKRPDLLNALEALLEGIDYHTATPGEASGDIADPDDKPILDAALSSDVDVIVTGDKHFLSLSIEQPVILTPRAFLESLGDGS